MSRVVTRRGKVVFRPIRYKDPIDTEEEFLENLETAIDELSSIVKILGSRRKKDFGMRTVFNYCYIEANKTQKILRRLAHYIAYPSDIFTNDREYEDIPESELDDPSGWIGSAFDEDVYNFIRSLKTEKTFYGYPISNRKELKKLIEGFLKDMDKFLNYLGLEHTDK